MAADKNSKTALSVTYAETVAAFVGDRAASVKSWPTTHTLFCDETGNSGSNYYYPDQPIYAEGGWLVAHDRRDGLEATILEMERSNGFTPKTKGTKLKGNTRGQEYIATVLDAVSQVATPFFYLVEKKYWICAKAVGTYFDPNYNPAIDPLETFDPRMNKLRADLLYAVPDQILAAFADAFRNQDPLAVTSVGHAWANALYQRRERGLALQLRAALPDLPRHMDREFATHRGASLPRGWDTLNAPSVAQVFQLIEGVSPPCDLVHDQCGSFEPIYRHFFESYRNATPDILPRLDGSREIFGFQRLNSLSFGDSEQLPLLRASDYLLATCVELTRRALAQEDISPQLHACAFHGLGRMMRESIGMHPTILPFQIGEIMASDAWIEKVAVRFAKA